MASTRRWFGLGSAAVMIAALLVPVLVGVAPAATPSGDRVGTYDPATALWTLDGAGSFMYGNPGDHPFMGDWDCDGVDTPGLHRAERTAAGPAGKVYLRNSNTTGIADIEYFFGNPGDVAFAGDFEGDGCDSVGLYRPATGEVFLTDRLGARDAGLGAAETSFVFPSHGYDLSSAYPAAADLDGDGATEVVLYLRDRGIVLTASGPFTYGDPGDQPVFGAWNGTAAETVGVYRGGEVLVRDSNTIGVADRSMPAGRSAVALSWSPTPRSSHPVSADIRTYAVFAVNSVDVERGVSVTGDVGVNTASAGPTLEPGFELDLDQQATVTGDVAADSVRQNRNTAVSGTVFYNNRDKRKGASDGGAVTPLTLPILTLPPFHAASVRPDPGDPLLQPLNVTVLAGVPASLAPGEYGDVNVDANASLTLAPGQYDFRSFTAGQSSTTSFAGAVDVRIEGRLTVGQSSVFGGGDASVAIVYVGGGNGGSGLTTAPLAAHIGQFSEVDANIYAPFGTLRLSRNSFANGSFIGRDVFVARDATVTAASAFGNRAPIAFNQEIRTSPDESAVPVTLGAFDPNGDGLTFTILSLPDSGDLFDGATAITAAPFTLSGNTVSYVPDNGGTVPIPETFSDSFDFRANDGEFDSNTATVSVKGPEAPADPPGVTGVDAEDQLFIVEDPPAAIPSGGVQVVTPNPVTITIEAAAPYTPNVSPDPPQPGDIGNLTFTIVTPIPSGEGTLTAPVNNSQNDPADPDRSATAVYDPGGFVGTTSFEFEACGSVVVAPPAVGTTFCDTALVEINVQAATPPVPPVANNIGTQVEVPDGEPVENFSVVVNLVEGAGDTTPPPPTPPPDPGKGRSLGDDKAPQIYFGIDSTGSMSSSLAQVKLDVPVIIAAVQEAFPQAKFGLGQYRDFPVPGSNSFAFQHMVALGAEDENGGNNADYVSSEVATIAAGEGGDLPEGQFYVLDQLMSASNVAGFTSDEPAIVVLIGDAPAHDEVCAAISGLNYDITESSVIAKLQSPLWASGGGGVTLITNTSSFASGGMNDDPQPTTNEYSGTCTVTGSAGQANRLTAATNGAHFDVATAAELAQAIEDAVEPPPPLTFEVASLPIHGTLFDSAGSQITAPGPIVGSNVTYVPLSGTTLGTIDQFEFKVVNTASGLSATAVAFVATLLEGQVIDPCVLVGRPPGCSP